jgi:hypothetical protein
MKVLKILTLACIIMGLGSGIVSCAYAEEVSCVYVEEVAPTKPVEKNKTIA